MSLLVALHWRVSNLRRGLLLEKEQLKNEKNPRDSKIFAPIWRSQLKTLIAIKESRLSCQERSLESSSYRAQFGT